MLKLVVVDATADNRNRLFARIAELLKPAMQELEFLPHIDIQQQSPDQLRFNEPPDVCIIGCELVRQDLTNVGKIKKTVGSAAMLVELSDELSNISILEQLARFGADDVLTTDLSSIQLIRKLVLLCRKPTRKNSGKLFLVDSGKGGLGVTTIAAGLAEAVYMDGKRVALVDFDLETQDLSRFLQVRPFINDNLQSLLDRSRPLTQEFIEECLLPVFDGDRDFTCMPPVPDSDGIYDPNSAYGRTLLSVLELLDASRDLVIIDVSSARGALLRTLYRVADGVIFVVNNDAAALFASVDRVQKLRHNLAPEARVMVIENCPLKHGLPTTLLRREFLRAAQLEENSWLSDSVPFCRQGYRWPGSGGSIYAQGSERLKQVFNHLARQVGLLANTESKSLLEAFSKKAWSQLRPKADNQSVAGVLPGPQMEANSQSTTTSDRKLIAMKLERRQDGSTNDQLSTSESELMFTSSDDLVSAPKLSYG